MTVLSGIELYPAAVHRSATFVEAAEALVAHPATTVAILDEEDRVVGLFGDAEVLGGIFPAYIAELHHTAFASDDLLLLDERTRSLAGEPIEKHMRRPVTLDVEAGALHVAERFIHCDFGALPVVREGRFVGMLGRAEFCRAVLGRAQE